MNIVWYNSECLYEMLEKKTSMPWRKEDPSPKNLNYEKKFDIFIQINKMNRKKIEIWILKNKDMKIYSLENDFFVNFAFFD